jgi:hypothetical protein
VKLIEKLTTVVNVVQLSANASAKPVLFSPKKLPPIMTHLGYEVPKS